jgi:hypothetical protein
MINKFVTNLLQSSYRFSNKNRRLILYSNWAPVINDKAVVIVNEIDPELFVYVSIVLELLPKQANATTDNRHTVIINIPYRACSV